MSNQFYVTAAFKGAIEGRREERVNALIEACLCGTGQFINGMELMGGVDWNEWEDGLTTIEMCITGRERAERLAAELRACGLSAKASPFTSI